MKTFNLIFIMALVISCKGQETSKIDMVESNPNLIGKWHGEVSFLTKKFDDEFGKLKIDFQIHKDNTITGVIGDAKIIESKIKKRNWGFEIQVKLDSKLKKDKNFNKKRCKILFGETEKIKEDIVEYNVDFNVGPQVGWVILEKKP